MPKTGSPRSPSLTSQENYSAVIIADLVAEVQQQPTSDKKVLSKVKEESNLDDCDRKAPDNSAEFQHIEVKTTIINPTNISKGVILNAAQFEQPDSEPKFIQFVAPDDDEEEEEVKKPALKFSEMSRLRKIAFGFSFIPSIMFVLCFSVIFPCIKVIPCEKEVWSITMNNTDVTSTLEVAQNVFFSFLTEEESGLRSVNKTSGETVWSIITPFPSLFMKCGYLYQPESPSCLVMDINGTLSLYDQSDGNKLWQLNSYEDKSSSLPAILPDCDHDGIDEITVAVSSSKMKVIFLGNESFIDVPECQSIPSNLLIWKRENKTDILLSCRNEGRDILLKIPQNKWCKYDKTASQTMLLMSTKKDVLSNSKIFPSEDGLTVWSEDVVTMFNVEGYKKWTVSASNHSKKNRFLLHGKVNEDEPRVILYSSDIESHFQVTMLDFEDGNVTLTKTIPNVEISEAALILGEKYDFVLSLRKKFTKSFQSEAGDKINKISASVMNLLTTEESILSSNATSKIVEELILMQLDGKDIQTLETFDYLEGQSHSTLFTAILKEKEDLDIYMVRKAEDQKSTALKRISVSNWDTSSPFCAWQ